MDVMYNDSITGKGKRRWYFFQLTEKKKVTAYMSPVADTTVDNDLSLYKLDTATGNLTEVASSQNPAAMYELLSRGGHLPALRRGLRRRNHQPVLFPRASVGHLR